MKVKIAFIVGAIVCFVFGLLLTFFPGFSASLFGMDVNEGGEFIARIFGASLLGYCITFWCVRNNSPSEARRSVILGEIVHSGIASILWIWGLFQSIGNLLTLIPLFCHLGLTIWFGILYLKGEK